MIIPPGKAPDDIISVWSPFDFFCLIARVLLAFAYLHFCINTFIHLYVQKLYLRILMLSGNLNSLLFF